MAESSAPSDSEQPPASAAGPWGEIIALAVALVALWCAPLVAAWLPNLSLSGMIGLIFVSSIAALANTGAAWTIYGPGTPLPRVVWNLAGPAALLWLTLGAGILLGFQREYRQEEVGLIGAFWGCIWLTQIALIGLAAFVGFPILPPRDRPTERSPWQFGVADLLGLMVAVAVLMTIVAQAAQIEFRPGWFSGWGVALFAPLALFQWGNIVPIAMVGFAAMWGAPRGHNAQAGAIGVALLTALIYAAILAIMSGDEEPYLAIAIATCHYFAFSWCAVRLLHHIRERTLGDGPAEQIAEKERANGNGEPTR